MRPLYLMLGLVALGIGLAGWATLGQAQPEPRGTQVKLPTGDPVVKSRDVEPATGPVRVIDPLEVPSVVVPKVSGVERAEGKDVTKTGVKPTVFIPTHPVPEAAKVGPAAKQEPAVSLEWHGATGLAVGQPAEYTLAARNTSAIPLHKVIVQVKVPMGVKMTGTEPKAEGNESVLMWDLGTMSPQDAKLMKLTFVPPDKGELLCQAWVTFTGSASLKVQVREPKLALTAKVPEKMSIGEAGTLIFSLSNQGDHPAEAMKLTVTLPAGLESKAEIASIDLGSVAPGEIREVKVPCKAQKAGAMPCSATATGAGNLKATVAANVLVVQPKLTVEVAGPKLRYLERKAVYTIKVTNTGDAPALNVVLNELVPTGFKFVSADATGKYDAESRAVHWPVGEMAPGEVKEVKCEMLAVTAGEFTHKVAAAGDRGLRSEASLPTSIEGLSAVAMEVIDTVDPIEVGGETSYEIRVSNTGSKDETDVKLVCTIPVQMKLKTARGPGTHEAVGTEVIFETLKKLPARTEVTFRLTVTATEKCDARFKATLTAGGLSEPVIKQESTRIYAD